MHLPIDQRKRSNILTPLPLFNTLLSRRGATALTSPPYVLANSSLVYDQTFPSWVPNAAAFADLGVLDPDMMIISAGLGESLTSLDAQKENPVVTQAELDAVVAAATKANQNLDLATMLNIPGWNLDYAKGTFMFANPYPNVIFSHTFSATAAQPITFYAGCLGTCTMSLNHGQQTWTLVSLFDPTPRPYVLQATTVAGVNTIDIYLRAFPDSDVLDLNGITGLSGVMLRANITSGATFFRTASALYPPYTDIWTWVEEALTSAELVAKYGLKGAIQHVSDELAGKLRTFQARATTLKSSAHAASDALQAQASLQHQRVKAQGAAMSARVKLEAAASTA